MSKPAEKPLSQLITFVKERRAYLRMRQQDVADRSGVSHGWVGSLEANRLKSYPLTDTLIKLSKALVAVGETPGMVANFLQLVQAGSFSNHHVREVASGKRRMVDLVNDAIAGRVEPPDSAEGAGERFHDQAARSTHLSQILVWLKEDLVPADYELARLFLRRLYEDAPISFTEFSTLNPPPKRVRLRRKGVG